MIDFKQLMFDKGLNQSDLAQIWGVSQSLVSKVVRGERGVPEYYIKKIIEHFGEDVIKKYTLPSDAYEPKVRDAKVTIVDAEIIEEAKELGREEAEGDVACSLPFVGKEIATSIGKSLEMLTESHKQLLDAHDILIAEMVKQNERMGKLVDKLIE